MLMDLHPDPDASEPLPSPTPNAPNHSSKWNPTWCWVCRQKGHHFTICPEKWGNMPCHYCDTIGHKVADCPDR